MGIRSSLQDNIAWVLTGMLASVRRTAWNLGLETAVIVDDHEISFRFVRPGDEMIAWDDDLYWKGNVFYKDYANPIKPVVERNPGLEAPDVVDAETGDVDDEEAAGELEEDVSMMSSQRYQTFMLQNVIEQLLRPEGSLTKLLWGIAIAVGLQMLTLAALVIFVL